MNSGKIGKRANSAETELNNPTTRRETSQQQGWRGTAGHTLHLSSASTKDSSQFSDFTFPLQAQKTAASRRVSTAHLHRRIITHILPGQHDKATHRRVPTLPERPALHGHQQAEEVLPGSGQGHCRLRRAGAAPLLARRCCGTRRSLKHHRPPPSDSALVNTCRPLSFWRHRSALPGQARRVPPTPQHGPRRTVLNGPEKKAPLRTTLVRSRMRACSVVICFSRDFCESFTLHVLNFVTRNGTVYITYQQPFTKS